MTDCLTSILAQDAWGQFWLGKSLGASTQAAKTEWVFMFVLWVNIISFVVLMVLMGYFMVKFRRSRQSTHYQVSSAHNTPLELAWSIIPLMVMVPIFYWGFRGYFDAIASPADAEEITIKGKMWNWNVIYPNGATPQSEQVQLGSVGSKFPEFVVPVGRPVRLMMRSEDVIHAFYIPDFRMKVDVTPNRYTSMWFEAEKTGIHRVYCAEYCGDMHSEMMAQMKVVSQQEYAETIRQWTDYKGTLSLLEVGKLIHERQCATCHSVDGKDNIGPTWKNMFGATHTYTSGESHIVDENWLVENILYSQKRIMTGRPTSMPIFAGQLKSMEMDALVLYIKSLSDKTAGEPSKAGEKTVDQYKAEQKK